MSSTGRSGVNDYVRHWDACAAVPFLFNSRKRHYVSYEDSKSAGLKAVRVPDGEGFFELGES